MAVWNRVVDRSSFLIATLRVFIKRKGLFFDRLLASGYYTCILSKQGHLVVYTQHSSNEGFATNLRKATRINFKLLNEMPSTNTKPFSQEVFSHAFFIFIDHLEFNTNLQSDGTMALRISGLLLAGPQND